MSANMKCTAIHTDMEELMNQRLEFAKVTKDYLNTFYCILDTMIQKMTEAELTDSISYNFIVQMIPHHRAAIEMSHNILNYTTNLSVQSIAENIITEQTKSIENMQKIKCRCAELTNPGRDVCLYQRRVIQILHTMFTGMEHARSTNRLDCNFMREMIPHHEGAVAMSENALRYDICPELIPILDAIIQSQKRGILQMQQLLICIRCC